MHFGTKSYLKSNRNHTAKQNNCDVFKNDFDFEFVCRCILKIFFYKKIIKLIFFCVFQKFFI